MVAGVAWSTLRVVKPKAQARQIKVAMYRSRAALLTKAREGM
jgi:hypothetical protein